MLRGGILRDDSGSCAVSTEQGSSASDMTAGKRWWMSLQDYLSVRDKQPTRYPLHAQSKNGGRSNNCSKFQSQRVQIHGYALHDINVLFNEMCTDIHLQASCGKDGSKKFWWDLNGKKYRIMSACSIDNKDHPCRCAWVPSKWLERCRFWLPCWRIWWKNVDLGEPTSCLEHVHLGCTQRECKPNEIIIDQFSEMF